MNILWASGMCKIVGKKKGSHDDFPSLFIHVHERIRTSDPTLRSKSIGRLPV